MSLFDFSRIKIARFRDPALELEVQKIVGPIKSKKPPYFTSFQNLIQPEETLEFPKDKLPELEQEVNTLKQKNAFSTLLEKFLNDNPNRTSK